MPKGGEREPAECFVIDTVLMKESMAHIDRDETYQKGEVFWDKGAPAPAMRQYPARQMASGRALVPGCGRGHEVALSVEHGLDAMGLK